MRKDSRKKVRKSEQKLSRYLEFPEMMETDIDRNIRLLRIIKKLLLLDNKKQQNSNNNKGQKNAKHQTIG